MTVDAAGRVQLTLDPALPSECVLCKKSSDGRTQFADFDLSLDWYGAVVFCENCVRELLQVVENQKVANLELQITHLQAELDHSNEQLERYKSIVDGLSAVRSDINPPDVVGEVEPDDSSEIQSEGSGDVSEPSEDTDGDESDSDGSDSSGGLENLSIFAD